MRIHINRKRVLEFMSPIMIHKLPWTGVTVISNQFLDLYMPQANGEFVKIYLYLLRMQNLAQPLSLTSIADRLNCTEGDVMRALKYWEKSGLLSLTSNASGEISDIYFLDFPGEATASLEASPVDSVKPEVVPNVQKAPQKVTLTADRLKELKENEDVVQLLYIAEQYLGRTLTATDTNTLMYFYDQLEMSAELIEYLIEYCVSKGSRSIRYIEKVAL